MHSYKQILFSNDFSDHIVITVLEGNNIIQKFGHDIPLLRIIEERTAVTNYLQTRVNSAYKISEENIKMTLAKFDIDLNINQISDGKIINGITTNSIAKYSSKNNIDVIMMVSCCNTGFMHLLLINGAGQIDTKTTKYSASLEQYNKYLQV